MDGTVRWPVGFEPEEKLFQIMAWAFDFNENALRRIVDPAVERQSGGEAMDEGTETDALHGAANCEPEAMNEPVCSVCFHARILPEAGLNSNLRIGFETR